VPRQGQALLCSTFFGRQESGTWFSWIPICWIRSSRTSVHANERDLFEQLVETYSAEPTAVRAWSDLVSCKGSERPGCRFRSSIGSCFRFDFEPDPVLMSQPVLTTGCWAPSPFKGSSIGYLILSRTHPGHGLSGLDHQRT
jgi:hypothetical protein